MPVYAVVPVKRLDTAKSRLASVLSAGERRQLVFTLLNNVLAALRESDAVAGIIVVSPDPAILKHAERNQIIGLEQRGRGLNAAIRIGRDRATSLGADALLVVLADLPRLTSTEIDQLVVASNRSAVTLAPDRHGHGTNAMILRPPDIMNPSFGVDSFQKHRHEAERLLLSVLVSESPGTAFDVDNVEDLIDFDRYDEGRSWTLDRDCQGTLSTAPGNTLPIYNAE